MIRFPSFKINLGLRVLAGRPDGYHNLETVMVPVQSAVACDALEILPAAEIRFETEGLRIPGRLEDNLCYRAWKLWQERYDIPPVHLFLLKKIPMGAGLGGGSSDAAATLTLLKDLFSLPVSPGELLADAALLGSDCPFFIQDAPMLATGRGEVLEQMELTTRGASVLVIKPAFGVDTGWAYRALQAHRVAVGGPVEAAVPVYQAVRYPLDRWKNFLNNDFEEILFPAYPDLPEIKNKLYSMGAIYASMSGSGSALYGIFTGEEEARKAQEHFRDTCWCCLARLSES